MSLGAKDLALEAVPVDHHFHVLCLRQDDHGRSRRVDPALRLSGGDPLHAMHPVLELQSRVGASPADLEDDLFVALAFCLALRDQLDLPAVSLRVAGVHLEEVGGEEGRLVPARALADLDDHVLFVVWVLRYEGQLELALQACLFRLQFFDFLSGIVLHLRVFLLGDQLTRLPDVGFGPTVGVIEIDQRAELRLFLAQALELGQVVVDVGVRQPLPDRVVASPDRFELLEHQAAASFSSSRAARNAARATSIWRSSGSRVVNFWVARKGTRSTLTTGLYR